MSGLNLLVCEDDLLIRMNLVDMLEEMGHLPVEAGDGKTALSILRESGADMLIADLGLPDMTGEELASQARTILPDLPVIYATGSTNVESTIDPALVRVLLKPYSLKALEEMVRELVQAKNVRASP